MVEAEPQGERAPRAPAWRARRWLLRALLVAAALAVALRAILPTALERGIPYAIGRAAGMPAAVRNADLWLLKGAVALEGVAVGQPRADAPPPSLLHPVAVDPASALLRWDRVYVHLDWWGLLHRTLRLRELEIDAPGVHLEREADGRIDPLAGSKLAAPAPKPEPPPKPEKPGKPWVVELDRLRVRSPDVRIADAPTGSPLLQLGLEEFTLGDLRVAGSDLRLGAVGIRGPVLRVRRDLVLGGAKGGPPPPPPAAPAATAEKAAQPPGYRVDRIAIEGAEFTLLTDAGPVEMSLALEARDVSAAAGARFPLKVQLGAKKGSIALDGKLGVLPPAFSGRVAWTDLPFSMLLIASVPELQKWLHSCSASGDLGVELSLEPHQAAVDLVGRVGIDSFALGDPEGKEVGVEFQSFEVPIQKAHVPIPGEGEAPAPIAVALGEVRLVDPKIRYARPTPELDQLLRGPKPAEKTEMAAKPAPAGQAPPPAAPTPVDLAVEGLAISGASLSFEDATGPRPRRGGVDGLDVDLHGVHFQTGSALAAALGALDLGAASVSFEDQVVEPPYRGGVRNLSVAARDLAFPALAAHGVRVRGVAPDGGSFALDGSLAQGSGDFTLDLKRLALPPFNPYSTSAAGYTLAGAASLQSKVKIRGARYDTRNAITLHKLDVTAQKAGDFERRFGVPLELALALLRDPSGDISLTVPVAVDEKGVSTGIGTIVAGALRQALVGALSSPLKMIGAVLPGGDKGGGGVSLEPLAFPAGQAVLPADQAARLDGLAQLLGSRPALKLSLLGHAGPADRPLVAEQMLVERVGGGDSLPDLEGAGFFARRRLFSALEKRARGEAAPLSPDDQVLLGRYVAAEQVPPDRMTALARRRAEAVRGALVSQKGVEAARIEVGAAPEAGDPAVVVEFGGG